MNKKTIKIYMSTGGLHMVSARRVCSMATEAERYANAVRITVPPMCKYKDWSDERRPFLLHGSTHAPNAHDHVTAVSVACPNKGWLYDTEQKKYYPCNGRCQGYSIY